MVSMVSSSGIAGGMAGMAAAIPAFRNFCSKAPPGGHFVFTGCHTKILLPATPLASRFFTKVYCNPPHRLKNRSFFCKSPVHYQKSKQSCIAGHEKFPSLIQFESIYRLYSTTYYDKMWWLYL